MITLYDIKSYLKISQDTATHDLTLAAFIKSAKQKIDTYCGRKFSFSEYSDYYDGNGRNTLYVEAYPIISISSLKYYDDTSGSFKDLIDGTGHTIANSVYTNGNKIQLRHGYTFPVNTEPKNIEVIYKAGYKCMTGSGTMSITAGGKTVTGLSTSFLSEVSASDILQCEGQELEINEVSSDTSLTVLQAAKTSIQTKSFSIKSAPADLQQVMLEMVTLMFQDSAQGKGRLGIASENVGTQATSSYTFKEVNWKNILDNYSALI